jgi:hypothetical protein
MQSLNNVRDLTAAMINSLCLYWLGLFLLIATVRASTDVCTVVIQ